MKNEISVFCLLAIVSVCAALLINQVRAHPLPPIYASKSVRVEQSVARISGTRMPDHAPNNHPGIIDLGEFKEVVAGRKTVVLDARPEVFHRIGHIPGSLSLSREEFEKDYTQYKSVLEADKAQMIVVYCNGSGCEDSGLVAEALVKLDYQNIRIFKGGWEQWQEQKLPTEGNP